MGFFLNTLETSSGNENVEWQKRSYLNVTVFLFWEIQFADNILLPSLPHVSQTLTCVALIHIQKKVFIPLSVIY